MYQKSRQAQCLAATQIAKKSILQRGKKLGRSLVLIKIDVT